MSELHSMSVSAMIERLQEQAGEIAALTAMVAERDQQLAAKDAELARVRSNRARLASAATMVVSNWDIFEIQDTTARQVFGSSIGWLRDALAPVAQSEQPQQPQQWEVWAVINQHGHLWCVGDHEDIETQHAEDLTGPDLQYHVKRAKVVVLDQEDAVQRVSEWKEQQQPSAEGDL